MEFNKTPGHTLFFSNSSYPINETVFNKTSQIQKILLKGMISISLSSR